MPSPRSNNVDEWITHFNEVDGGPGWGVGALLDEIERLRALLGAADPTPPVAEVTVDAMAWYCSTCDRPRPEVAKCNFPCPECHSYDVYGRGVGHADSHHTLPGGPTDA
jgi:hypothetical protein